MSNKLTKSEFKILQKLAEQKGFEVCGSWKEMGVKRYPYITLLKKGFVINGSVRDKGYSFNDALIFFSKIKKVVGEKAEKEKVSKVLSSVIENGINNENVSTLDLLKKVISECERTIELNF